MQLEEVPVARRLDSFPAAHAQRYPWEEWLDGNVWQLDRGADYSAKATTIISNARLQARRRGGSVRTRFLKHNGQEAIVLQFTSGAS